jgi:PAS domain S-box-containing protein
VFIVYLIFAYTAIREPSKIVFAEIENERSTFKEYLEKMPAIVLAMDTSGRIILANSRACEVLECSKEELVNGTLFYNFYPENEKEKAQEGFKRVISGDFQKYENIKREIITKSGKRRIVEFRNSLIYDRDGKIVGVLATGEDVTEKEMYEKKLKDLASLDSLTGVLNKRAGFDALNETIKEANLNKSNFTICFMDVDNLKLVNDKYGHKVGDEYLTKIAKTLLNVLRKDDYVIRFGEMSFSLF